MGYGVYPILPIYRPGGRYVKTTSAVGAVSCAWLTSATQREASEQTESTTSSGKSCENGHAPGFPLPLWQSDSLPRGLNKRGPQGGKQGVPLKGI